MLKLLISLDLQMQYVLSTIASGKGKDHHFHEIVVSSVVKLIFTETAMFTSPREKSMARKVHRASHGPRVLAKGR